MTVILTICLVSLVNKCKCKFTIKGKGREQEMPESIYQDLEPEHRETSFLKMKLFRKSAEVRSTLAEDHFSLEDFADFYD